MSKKTWDKLSAKEQQIVQEAAYEARDYERQVSRADSSRAFAELKAKGMQVNELSPAELTRMRAQLKPVSDKFAASYDPAFMRDFNAEMERIRRK
jgi:TRAP-type transport system periplasmic protein